MHSYPYPYPPPPPSPPAPPLPYASISTLILVYAVLSYVVTYFIHRYEESRTSLDMRNSSLGLSPRNLQALPWFQCEADTGISSVICLDSFQKADRCRCLPACKHTFHARCIDLWLLQRLSCPTCRSPFVISYGLEAV